MNRQFNRQLKKLKILESNQVNQISEDIPEIVEVKKIVNPFDDIINVFLEEIHEVTIIF